MSRSQSGNSQLIGLLVVGVFVLGAIGFLFMSDSADATDPNAIAPVTEVVEENLPVEGGTLDPGPIRQPARVDSASRTDLDTGPALTSNDEAIGAAVYGVVINNEGHPVAEAIVSLTQKYNAGTLLADFQKTQRFEAETDSKGRYRFRKLPANKDMNIWVYHGDYAPTQGPNFASLADESQELPPIVLKDGYAIAGQVTDTNHNPLSAKVQLRKQKNGFKHSSPEEQLAEDRALGRLLEVQADENGNFQFKNIAEGIWILRADMEGFASSEVRPIACFESKSIEDQEVILDDEHHIAGRAVDENDQPIVNGLVNVSRVQPRPILTGSTRTLDDGSFDVRGLAAGVYGLSVQAEGYTNGHAGRVQADTETLVVVMQQKAGVTGRITNPDGGPVAKFSLEIMRTRSGTKQYGMTGATYEFSSTDGTYALESLDPGTFILLARAPGLAATYSAPFRIDREEVAGIDIPMKAGGVVVGQVIDGTTHKPIAGALISLHGDEYNPDEIDSLFGASLGDPNNIPRLTATTDRDGKFRLENSFPGTVQILVSHKKYLPELVATTVIENSNNDLGAISIFQGGSIFGIARNKDGGMLTGGSINLSRKDGGSFFHKRATVDARGRFRFDGLKAGSYELVAYPPSNESMFLFPPEGDKKSVYVADGTDVEVDLNSSL
ncbi:MAG: carboxypeptidase regulatory-like domain-containing protein [Planctomycetota bacterium]